MTRPSTTWAPALDLTPKGLSQFDPERVRHAIDEGYRAGLEAGRAEAHAAARDALRAELDALRTEATSLFAALAGAVERLERHEAQTAACFADELSSAAVRVAEAIVDRELSDETTAAVAALERSIADLGRRHQVRVHLHPEDIALLEGATIPENVDVEPNPGLRRGDAIAETDDATVDARIGTALDRALAALEGRS